MTILTTVGLQQSIRQGWPLAILAFIDHPDGSVHLWSGTGAIQWNGATWDGVRNFGGIEGLGGAMRLGVRQVVLSLAGTPAEAALSLNANVRNRAAQAWIAGLDADGGQVNGAPWPVVDGLADYQEIEVGEERRARVLIHAADPVFQLEQAQELVWSAEQIRADHGAAIAGLDFVHLMRDRSLSWTKDPPGGGGG